MSLGDNIKKFRRAMGITQEELAGILFVTGQAVSKWESNNGLPDTAQIVPLAKALNVSTDALFGFNTESYDKKFAEEVCFKANTLRDTGSQIQGALDAADYLNQKCEENIFNYRILARYVQSVAHLSRFTDSGGLFKDEPEKWQTYLKAAVNRSMQVIRYSDENELIEKCHYAMAWIYWHEKEYDKGLEHVNALPSIGNNMLRETIAPYYSYADPDKGMEGWNAEVRNNYQNFIRAINKQFVYAAESMMWKEPVEAVEKNCYWAISVMDEFMKNEKMKAHCQGFYRETYKFLVASYLRNGMVEKAAEQWKKMMVKIEEYLEFCNKINERKTVDVQKEFGEKSAENMSHYTKEYIEGKIEFMKGQLKNWTSAEAYEEFQKLIQK